MLNTMAQNVSDRCGFDSHCRRTIFHFHHRFDRVLTREFDKLSALNAHVTHEYTLTDRQPNLFSDS